MEVSPADLALRALRTHDEAQRPKRPDRAPAATFDGGQLGALGLAGWEVVGLIGGAAVHHVGVVGWPQGNAEVEVLSSAMYAAREEALSALRATATERGADGVIGVTVDLHFLKDHRHLPRFVATGTAVRRRDPIAGKRRSKGGPFVASLSAIEFLLLAEAGWHPLGLVMGSCVYHVARGGISRWATGVTRNAEMAGYTTALYEAREIAMARLQTEAGSFGAAGVIGVSTSERSHVWGSRVIEFFASGTAVRFEPTPTTTTPIPLVMLLNEQAVTTSPEAIANPRLRTPGRRRQ